MSSTAMSDLRPAPPHRAATPPGATPVEWLRFGCPRCGKKNKSPATMAGKVVCCARCHGSMTVPTVDAAPPPAAPPKPTLDDLSTHVAARAGKAKRRKGWPWWLIAAHLALPILTLTALWYLHTTGRVPWIDPYLQQLKSWVGPL